MRHGRKAVLKGIGVVSVCALVLGISNFLGGQAARAGNGDPVLLGFGNNATLGTSINSSSGDALRGVSNDSGNANAAGLRGEGPNGLWGDGSVTGVRGSSQTGYGVRGTTADNTRAGVVGENTAATNSGGSGIVGIADHNIGVSAISSDGTALAVTGVASFSRSGRATVQAGSNKATIQHVKLSPGSLVLATVQQVGRPAVRAAVPNIANHRFTIYLVKPTVKNAVVAWFVMG